MARIRIEKDSMTIDKAVWEALGSAEARYVEATLKLNPGLAAAPVILPVGTEMEIPEIDNSISVIKTIRLWD